jgi:hypothetical protein
MLQGIQGVLKRVPDYLSARRRSQIEKERERGDNMILYCSMIT